MRGSSFRLPYPETLFENNHFTIGQVE